MSICLRVIFLHILCIVCEFCLHSYQGPCWDAFLDFTWTFAYLCACRMYSVLIACIGCHVLTFWFDFVPCAVHNTWCFITHVLAQYRLIGPDTCAWFLFLCLVFAHTFLTSLWLTTVGVMRLHHATASCDWHVRWRLASCLLPERACSKDSEDPTFGLFTWIWALNNTLDRERFSEIQAFRRQRD